jgi:sodium/bile acid cotransporter 7
VSTLARLRPDNFTLALLGTVVIASLLPARGIAAQWLDAGTDIAIAALFFLHGARLPRQAMVAGLLHWRLHLLILACTFALYPLLGVLARPAASTVLTPELALGLLFLCALPSTVQSSIAFTAMAGGNVAAAVCSASLSSLLGVFLTPWLMTWLAGSSGAMTDPLGAVAKIMLLLLAPFVAGHLLRPWIGKPVDAAKPLLRYTDQATILLVVYAAFGAAVLEGLWSQTPARALLLTTGACAVLLAIAMPLVWLIAKRSGFERSDQIAVLFCGTKKSLATGVPIAKVLFAGGPLGAIVLPVMLYHQLQLIVCAIVAARLGQRAPRD